MSFYFLIDSDTDLTALADEVTSWHNVTGYDLSEHAILKLAGDSGQEVEVLKLTFEARFFKKDIELTDWLFHVTSLNAAKKIVVQGLVPMSKNSFFKYSDRVYLFNNTDPMQIVSYTCSKAQSTKSMQLVMFRISSKALQQNALYRNGKMMFYVDPKYDVKDIAIYTHDNVPRSLLDSKCTLLEVSSGSIASNKVVSIEDIEAL